MAMTQMNVRIEEETKKAGDAAFESAGYTTSRVVRAVWEFAQRNRHDIPAVTSMMQELEGCGGSVDDEQERMLELVCAGPLIFEKALEAIGTHADGGFGSASTPYDELLAAAYAEKQLVEAMA